MKLDEHLIRHHADYIELLICNHKDGYAIEHSRMDTPEKVLGWVYHLTQKGISRDHLIAFLDAAKDNGVEFDMNA
jgi:hypothetical protein